MGPPAQARAVVARALSIIKRIELPGHPEGFEVESSGRLIYVNVPSTGQVVVVDSNAGKIPATWDLAGASQNFPIALDEANHRLLAAARRPPEWLA